MEKLESQSKKFPNSSKKSTTTIPHHQNQKQSVLPYLPLDVASNKTNHINGSIKNHSPKGSKMTNSTLTNTVTNNSNNKNSSPSDAMINLKPSFVNNINKVCTCNNKKKINN